ncbi:MAG: tRNA (N(6)-L-threonylcarbamoyladenosine(37)-C(2))-methylthiotransferase MtaB [Elusimicrobia bacterium RIFOXYB2_FULL_48_7]|nr:MAG: tRNA (N(6)-L-threonylcarbamoyladenosine(37)-C(2))-methylthiotransferase MtaB [Elusimicrobia bacterium RIFOXYB2_FULL_48_7]
MRIYFYTSGCKVNQYETQLLREQLCAPGNELTENIKEADICVINSCTVTHKADADCRQVARRALRDARPDAKIIVTGCYAAASAEEISKISPNIIVCADKSKIRRHCEPPVVWECEAITKRDCRGLRPRKDIIHTFHAHSRAFVKIQDGCDAFCSYCIVPHVRPELWSKPEDVLFDEIEALVKNGYSEVVLCGIRLGKWSSGGFGLTELVKNILARFENIKIHFSSLEIGEITDELLKIMAGTDRIVPHFHIPLQSGDNDILKKMKRPYTAEQFMKKLEKIYSEVPGVKITTDVIAGFPGESEKQFNNTAKFVKRCKFDKLHVFRYSPRRGTPASVMPGQVNPAETARRARLLLTR